MATQAAVTSKAQTRLAGASAGKVGAHLVLIIFSVGGVAPFIWMVFSSFKHYKELVESTDLLPQVWTLDNYSEIIHRVNFLVAVENSVIAAVSVTVASVFTSAAVGFVFAKYRFPGKEILFSVLLSTMMIPFAVVLIPLYVFIADIHLIDTLPGIIVTGLWSTFGIFLLRQFMESLPTELLDAARIDGASEFRIFAQVVIPLSGAPLAALATLTFLGNWDSFLWPTIVLSSPEKQTIPIVLNGLRSLYWSRYDMWTAGAMLTVVPVMVIYAFASRHFIRGIAMTGLKG
jgi:multiple sugar transport system permease protein